MFVRNTLAVITVLLAAQVGSGAILADYPLTPPLPDQAVSVDTDPQTTASSMSVAGDVGFSSSDGLFIRTNESPNSDPGALAASDYAQFSITPGGLVQVDYINITGTVSGTGGTGFTSSWAIYSSIDGFATDAVLHGTATDPAGGSETVFDFSLATRTDIAGTLTIRLVAFDSENVSNRITRTDNIVVNGDVELIPEPTTMVLGASGALLLLRRFRA